MGNDSLTDGSKSTNNKVLAAAVTILGLMFAMLVALVVVVILFSVEMADLSSRYNQAQVAHWY